MKHTLSLIPELRLLVGYLGEKSQNNWWASNFISKSSVSFLTPIFPRTVLLSQYHGVCEAAQIVHDEHIGIGVNYHLYRLPDSIENAAAKSVQDDQFSKKINATLVDQETAYSRLSEIAENVSERSEGPTLVGDFSDKNLEKLIIKSAAHYLNAFKDGYRCFPYMRGA